MNIQLCITVPTKNDASVIIQTALCGDNVFCHIFLSAKEIYNNVIRLTDKPDVTYWFLLGDVKRNRYLKDSTSINKSLVDFFLMGKG